MGTMIYPCPTHGPERRDERFRELDERIAAEDAAQRSRAASRAPVPCGIARVRVDVQAGHKRERGEWLGSVGRGGHG